MIDEELTAAGFEIKSSRGAGRRSHYVLAARNGIDVSVLEYPESLSIFADSPKMLFRAVIVPSEPFNHEAWERTPV